MWTSKRKVFKGLETYFDTSEKCDHRKIEQLLQRSKYFISQVIKTVTVESRYLELGYLEFCETRSVYLNHKYILIAFSNHNLAFEFFLQVQITRSAN